MQRDSRRTEKAIGARWAHFDAQIRRELGGTGLWVDTTKLSVEETIEIIIALKSEALLTPLTEEVT